MAYSMGSDIEEDWGSDVDDNESNGHDDIQQKESDVEEDWGSDVDDDLNRMQKYFNLFIFWSINIEFSEAFAHLESDESDDDESVSNFNPLNHINFGKRVDVDVAPRFGLTGSAYYVEFDKLDKIQNVNLVARTAFDKVLEDAFNDWGESDLVGVSIDHPSLDHEILVRFSGRHGVTTDKVLEVISGVQQSKKDLDFDSIKTIIVTYIYRSG